MESEIQEFVSEEYCLPHAEPLTPEDENPDLDL